MAKNGSYDQKCLGLRTFQEKQKRHFSCFIVIQLCAKNKKDPMRGFLEKEL